MEKDLRDKELGVGISQREDGWYIGRYTSKFELRKKVCLKKLVHKLVHKSTTKIKKASKIKGFEGGNIKNETRNRRLT